MRRLLLLTDCSMTISILVAIGSTASASAAPTIELTRGTVEPVESITTQLGAVVTNGGG